MTEDQVLGCLRELRALERLARVIRQSQLPAFEWQCALNAMSDRIGLLTFCLAEQDAMLVASVEELAQHECTGIPVKMIEPDPPGARKFSYEKYSSHSDRVVIH